MAINSKIIYQDPKTGERSIYIDGRLRPLASVVSDGESPGNHGLTDDALQRYENLRQRILPRLGTGARPHIVVAPDGGNWVQIAPGEYTDDQVKEFTRESLKRPRGKGWSQSVVDTPEEQAQYEHAYHQQAQKKMKGLYDQISPVAQLGKYMDSIYALPENRKAWVITDPEGQDYPFEFPADREPAEVLSTGRLKLEASGIWGPEGGEWTVRPAGNRSDMSKHFGHRLAAMTSQLRHDGSVLPDLSLDLSEMTALQRARDKRRWPPGSNARRCRNPLR